MLSDLFINMGLDIFGRGAMQFACGFIVAFSIMLFFGRPFINKMRALQGKGQPIRKDGPSSHLAKAGTPTMGGVLILIAVAVSSLLFMDYTSLIPWTALLSLFLFGAIGFVDDWGKVKKYSANAGLSAKGRLVLEGLCVLLLAFLINKSMPVYLPELSIMIPVINYAIPAGIFYFVFAYFVIVGSANAANITDGLDGMLSKILLPVLVALTICLYGATHADLFGSSVFLPEAVALYPVLGAVFGAVLGFLWYNSTPAAIFMGDVGSLALGGFMGTVAMLLKVEFIMGIAAFMMVMILASSFIQVLFYRLTKKNGVGKRIFKMAPLHHHFELCGWIETKIVDRFFIISILFASLALAILKI